MASVAGSKLSSAVSSSTVGGGGGAARGGGGGSGSSAGASAALRRAFAEEAGKALRAIAAHTRAQREQASPRKHGGSRAAEPSSTQLAAQAEAAAARAVAAVAAASATTAAPPRDGDDAQAAQEHLWLLRGKLADCVAHYVGKLPKAAGAASALDVGAELIKLGEHRLALTQCYSRCLEAELLGAAAVAGEHAAAEHDGELCALEAQANFGAARCKLALATEADPSCALPATPRRLLAAMAQVRRGMELALPVEELYWLVHDGSVHMSRIAAKLLAAGLGALALEGALFAALAFEKVLQLCLPRHLRWRVELVALACTCYEAAGKRSLALAFAARGLGELEELYALEKLEPIALPAESEAAYTTAIAAARTLTVKYDPALGEDTAEASDKPFDAQQALAAFDGVESQLQTAIEALRSASGARRPGQHAPATTAQAALCDAAWALVEAPLREMAAKLDEADAAASAPAESVDAPVAEGNEGEAAAAIEAAGDSQAPLSPSSATRAQEKAMAAAVASASEAAAPVPLDLLVGLARCLYQHERNDSLGELVALGIRRAVAALACDAEGALAAQGAALELSMLRAMRVMDDATSADAGTAPSAEGVPTITWSCGSGEQLDGAVASALAALDEAVAGGALPRAADLATDLAMRVWGCAGAALCAIPSPSPDSIDAFNWERDDVEPAVAQARGGAQALETLHAVLAAAGTEDALCRARIAASLCALLGGLGRHRKSEKVAAAALEHLIAVRSEEAERFSGSSSNGSATAPFVAASDEESMESALAGLQADLTALRFRGALLGSMAGEVAKAEARRTRVARDVTKQEEQATAYGGLLASQTRANAKRMAEANRMPDHPAKEQRRLTALVDKNPYESALLLVEMASFFPHEPARAGPLLSAACGKAREAAEAEASLRAAAAMVTAAPRGRVPAAPRVVARAAGAVVVGAPQFNLKAQENVEYFAVYAKPLGSGIGVSLNNTGLAGCGELVPVGAEVRVSGLRTNEMYMFAVAAYDKAKRLVGDGIGASTAGIPALLPLPTLSLWSAIGLCAARVGCAAIAREAFGQVTEKFLLTHDLGAFWDAHPADDIELDAAALASAPAATLRALCQVLLASAALSMFDGDNRATSTDPRKPPFEKHIGALRAAKLRLMALEVAATIGDEALIEEAGLRVHKTLAPLRKLRRRANWLAKPLGRANLALSRCISAKRGGSPVAASAAAVAYDLVEIYKNAGEADAAAMLASITRSDLLAGASDEGDSNDARLITMTVNALEEYIATLPGVEVAEGKNASDKLVRSTNALLQTEGAEKAYAALSAAPICGRTLEALYRAAHKGIKEGKLAEVQEWIDKTVKATMEDFRAKEQEARQAAEADEATRAERYEELVKAREEARAAARAEAEAKAADANDGEAAQVDPEAEAAAVEEEARREAAALVIQRGLRSKMRSRDARRVRAGRDQVLGWQVRTELLRTACEMEQCLQNMEAAGGPSFMLVSEAEAAAIEKDAEADVEPEAGAEPADDASQPPSPELQLALRVCRCVVLACRQSKASITPELASAARALTDLLADLFPDGAAPREARALACALEVAIEELLATMQLLRNGDDGSARPTTAFSAASDAPPTEPWFLGQYAASHMHWTAALSLRSMRRMLDAGKWHATTRLSHNFNTLTDDAFADKSLPMAMEAAEALGDTPYKSRVRKRLEQLRRDKNLAQSALEDCRALWAQCAEAEIQKAKALGGHSLATARPLSRGSTRGRGGGHVHAVLAAYAKAVEMLRLRTGKDAKLMHVQALNEMGDVHASLGDYASASVAWSDGIDALFGAYQATRDWRATLRSLGGRPLDVLGLRGCLLGVCVLTKVATSTYMTDVDGRKRCCELAAALVAATFECSIVHPQRLIDFTDYVPVELWEDLDFLDDPYMCTAKKLIYALEVVASVLLKSGDVISSFNSAQGEPAYDALAALPVLSLLEHMCRHRTRVATGTAAARAMRVRALCLLGRVAPASSALVTLIHGDDVPWRGSLLGSRTSDQLPAETNLPRPKPYRADVGADHPDNAEMVKFMAEAELPEAVRKAYGANATANIQFARARWLMVAGTTARRWAVTDPTSEDGEAAEVKKTLTAHADNELFKGAIKLITRLQSDADAELKRVEEKANSEGGDGGEVEAEACGGIRGGAFDHDETRRVNEVAHAIKCWGGLIMSYMCRARQDAPGALAHARGICTHLRAMARTCSTSVTVLMGAEFELALDRILIESLVALGRRDEAREACKRGLESAIRARAERHAVVLEEILAKLALADGDVDAAVELAKRSIKANDRLGLRGARPARCLVALAALCLDLGDPAEALAASGRAAKIMEALCADLALQDSDKEPALRRACFPGVDLLAAAKIAHARAALELGGARGALALGGARGDAARACELARTYPDQVDPALAAAAYATLGAAEARLAEGLAIEAQAGPTEATAASEAAARHLSAAVRISVCDGGHDRTLVRAALVQLARTLLLQASGAERSGAANGDDSQGASWKDQVGRAVSCLKAAERAAAMATKLLGATDELAAGLSQKAAADAPEWALSDAREAEAYAAARAASSGPAPAAAGDKQLPRLVLRAGVRAALRAGGASVGLDRPALQRAAAMHAFLLGACEAYASGCCFSSPPLPGPAVGMDELVDGLVCAQWHEAPSDSLQCVYVAVVPPPEVDGAGDDGAAEAAAEAQVLRGAKEVDAERVAGVRRAVAALRAEAEAAQAAGKPLPPRARQQALLRAAAAALLGSPLDGADVAKPANAVTADGDDGDGVEDPEEEKPQMSAEVVRQVEALLSPGSGLAAVAPEVATALAAAEAELAM